MALDEAIFQHVAEGLARPTVRFYQWQPACLSLGYSQPWHDVDQAACAERGYTWTRRATGGKAILHQDELTYSMIIPKDDPRIEGGIMRSYRALSGALLAGLHRLGLGEASQAPKRDQPRTKKERQGPVCFDRPGAYEIVWQGKKLVGSAQLRRKSLVLQHGTLPLHGDLNRIIDVLIMDDAARAEQRRILPERAVTLHTALGRIATFDEVASALTAGFIETLNLTFERSDPTSDEWARADRLRQDHYESDAWNRRM